jgi:hypothetical protein
VAVDHPTRQEPSEQLRKCGSKRIVVHSGSYSEWGGDIMTIGILDAFLDGFTGVGFYERVRLPGPPTTYRQAMIALSYGFAASLTVIAALSTWSFMTIRRRLMFLSVLCSPGSSSDQFASVETIDHFEENLGTRDRPIRNAAPATAGPISLMGSISNSCTDEHNKCDGEEAAEEEEKDPADQVEEEGGYLEGKMDHGIPPIRG